MAQFLWPTLEIRWMNAHILFRTSMFYWQCPSVLGVLTKKSTWRGKWILWFYLQTHKAMVYDVRQPIIKVTPSSHIIILNHPHLQRWCHSWDNMNNRGFRIYTALIKKEFALWRECMRLNECVLLLVTYVHFALVNNVKVVSFIAWMGEKRRNTEIQKKPFNQ